MNELGKNGLMATAKCDIDHYKVHPASYIGSVRAYKVTPVVLE